MKFGIYFHKKAARELGKLEGQAQRRIKDEISELERNPEKGKHLRYCNFWSLRIGDYRAIYEIRRQENMVVILFIGHRKNVYDDFAKLF